MHKIPKSRPKYCFERGYYERIKTKRHYDTKYDLYHYFLPAKLSPVIRFLKKYFLSLDDDSYLSPEERVPKEFRFRQTEFEYAEAAIHTFHLIRCRISVNKPIFAGCERVSPCAWAIFGPNNQGRLARNNFESTKDIFNHYDNLMWGRGGYNITAINRPLNTNPDVDGLFTLTEIYDKSANYLLAVSLFLLFDIIRKCGPECGEFPFIFTNDKRAVLDPSKLNYHRWIRARNSVIPEGDHNYGDLWMKYNPHFTSPARKFHSFKPSIGSYSKVPNKNKKRTLSYFDVKLIDENFGKDIAFGEKIELFQSIPASEPIRKKRELKPNEPMFNWTKPSEYDDLTEDDISGNNETEEFDHYKALAEFAARKQTHNEIAKGWY